jgi:pimeloyl-ACP methyl ester carboxylesterase
MIRAIETREVIDIPVTGLRLRGTYHRPKQYAEDGNAAADRPKGPGLLFLNHGFLPRAAPGDSAVGWADSLASSGYSCFRFDLPGLGDSDGEPPTPMLDFVNRGGYAPIVSALSKQLIERYALSGIVIVGHCAGSVTALFTAPLTRECQGLVLTDPYFFLPRERTQFRIELSHWTSFSRLGAMASRLYHFVKHIRLLMRRNRPPWNANLPLLRCWKQLSSAGVPMLVLKAPSLRSRDFKPGIGEFDYLSYLQAMSGGRSRVAVEYIENTNHSFADDRGRAAVLENLQKWLDHHFPVRRAPGLERPISATAPGAYEAVYPR